MNVRTVVVLDEAELSRARLWLWLGGLGVLELPRKSLVYKSCADHQSDTSASRMNCTTSAIVGRLDIGLLLSKQW